MLLGSTVLEVAIGMIFVYLLLSLICSATNEVIATNTKRRARMLERGLSNLLLDSALNKQLSADALKKKRVELKEKSATEGDEQASVGAHEKKGANAPTLGNIFYEHPLIKSLYHPRWFGLSEKKPAYIPARTFTLTLLDIITPEKPGESKTINDIRAAVERLPEDSSTRRSLLTLIDEAEGDIDKFRINVEDWFNVGMDRVSDWYKRRTQRVIFVIGLVLAALLNADSIMILKVLYSEPAVRTAMLAQAEGFANKNSAQPSPTPTPVGATSGETPSGAGTSTQGGALTAKTNGTAASQGAAKVTPTPTPTPTPIPASVQAENEDAAIQKETKAAQQKLEGTIQEYKQLENLGLPIGWSNKGVQIPRRPTVAFKDDSRRFLWEWFQKLAGLLITGFALSLGAPFWFDLLNRFISFRTALKPPEATPEKRDRSMSLTTPPRPPNEPGHSALPLESGQEEASEEDKDVEKT